MPDSFRNTHLGRIGGEAIVTVTDQGLGSTRAPAGDGVFTDHAGPDASALVRDFARRHPKQ